MKGKKKRRETLLAPLMLRLVFQTENNKLWLNLLASLLWWHLDTWVSGIQVSGQVTKEAECLRDAKQDQAKLRRVPQSTVIMTISVHCKLGIGRYHIHSEGCSASAVTECRPAGTLDTIWVYSWVFLWTEAGHPYTACLTELSSWDEAARAEGTLAQKAA